MNIEQEIRNILREGDTVDKKVAHISKLVTWDKIKLKEVILKYKGADSKSRTQIINQFWNTSIRRKREKR